MAKVMAKLLLMMGACKNDNFVYVPNSLELIGQYLGHTGPRVEVAMVGFAVAPLEGYPERLGGGACSPGSPG